MSGSESSPRQGQGADLLRTENAVKVYNPGRPDEVRALHQVSVAVAPGEAVVLRGPSGSGKSSLLSLMACMARPTSGRVWVAGRDVAKLPERFLTDIRRQTFGFIFQQFNLVRDLPVLDNVLLPLYPLATGFGEMKERAAGLLQRLGLAQRVGLKVRQLSGGEQQRVAIARALVNDPAVLIADEPTAHLDSRLAAEFMAILGELRGDGKTLVIASHDPFVCEHPLVTRQILLHDGRVQGGGSGA